MVEVTTFVWHRHHDSGYEVSSLGDRRFSALFARLKDGRTIEQAYQLDVKGYRAISSDWKVGKGKKPINGCVNLWAQYLALWIIWCDENPRLVEDLRASAKHFVLTDAFAKTEINQARALAYVLNQDERL